MSISSRMGGRGVGQMGAIYGKSGVSNYNKAHAVTVLPNLGESGQGGGRGGGGRGEGGGGWGGGNAGATRLTQ